MISQFPGPGREVLLRGALDSGYDLLDLTTGEPLALGLPTLRIALERARHLKARALWQQSFDHRGRPLGPPAKLAF